MAIDSALRKGRAASGWERFFWPVFNRSSIPMVIADDQRVRVAVNRSMCDHLKRSRAELVGRKIDCDISPPTLAQFRAARERLIQLDDAIAEGRGGSVRWCVAALAVRRASHRDRGTPARPGRAPVGRRGRRSGRSSRRRAELSGAVVHLLTLGLTSGEIAERLSISVTTVRTHVRNAMAKTGAKTRAQLVAIALAAGETYPQDARPVREPRRLNHAKRVMTAHCEGVHPHTMFRELIKALER